MDFLRNILNCANGCLKQKIYSRNITDLEEYTTITLNPKFMTAFCLELALQKETFSCIQIVSRSIYSEKDQIAHPSVVQIPFTHVTKWQLHLSELFQ